MNEASESFLKYIEGLPPIEDSEDIEAWLCCVSQLKDVLVGLGVEDKRVYRALDAILRAAFQNIQTIDGFVDFVERIKHLSPGVLYGIDPCHHKTNKLEDVDCNGRDASEHDIPLNGRFTELDEVSNALGLSLDEGKFDTAQRARPNKNSDICPAVAVSCQPQLVPYRSSPQFTSTVPDELEDDGNATEHVDDEPELWEQVVQEARSIARDADVEIERERRRQHSFRIHGLYEAASECRYLIGQLIEVREIYYELASTILINNLNPRYYQFGDDRITICHQLASSMRNLTEIDLHRQHERDALRIVKGHIALCRLLRVGRTELICGKGKSSKDRISKLKPSLLEPLTHVPGIVVSEHDKNEGRLVVDILEFDPIYAAKLESLSRLTSRIGG